MNTRNRMFLVHVRWNLPDGTSLDREIAELAYKPAVAHRRVMAHYTKPALVATLGEPTFVSVIARPYDEV